MKEEEKSIWFVLLYLNCVWSWASRVWESDIMDLGNNHSQAFNEEPYSLVVLIMKAPKSLNLVWRKRNYINSIRQA